MRQVRLKGYDMTKQGVYIVTATTPDTTWKWVYEGEEEAKRLVDLGKAHGGDVHWEQYEYDIGMTPEEALADFIEWTEEGEDA
jgi:hypothetical protein